MDNCIEWNKGKDRDGYGHKKKHGKTFRVHRIVYEQNFGPIPKGLFICHKCDNPSCINPKHLFLGTPLDNVKDMINKGRKIIAKGSRLSHQRERNPSAKLIELHVKNIRDYFLMGMSQKKLSVIFNISRSQIGRIVRNESWKE